MGEDADDVLISTNITIAKRGDQLTNLIHSSTSGETRSLNGQNLIAEIRLREKALRNISQLFTAMQLHVDL